MFDGAAAAFLMSYAFPNSQNLCDGIEVDCVLIEFLTQW